MDDTALLGDYPQGMDDARNIKEDTEYDIDNKILAKTLFDEHRNKGDEYRQDDEQNVALFLRHVHASFLANLLQNHPLLGCRVFLSESLLINIFIFLSSLKK
jgi:hypothetical protein